MWTAIVVGSLGCYALKLAGLSVPARWLEAPRPARIASLLPVALLSALVATQTFADGRHLSVDARLAGLVVAVTLVWRRAPFLVVVFAGAATAALARLAA
jgi:hypothetical protein